MIIPFSQAVAEVNEILYLKCICDACHCFQLWSSPQEELSSCPAYSKAGAEPGPSTEGSGPGDGASALVGEEARL